jgi:hypothetical protein
MEHILAAAECWMQHLRKMADQIDLELKNYRAQRQVSSVKPQPAAKQNKKEPQRNLTDDSRARIREAQQRRWAEYRKQKQQAK